MGSFRECCQPLVNRVGGAIQEAASLGDVTPSLVHHGKHEPGKRDRAQLGSISRQRSIFATASLKFPSRYRATPSRKLPHRSSGFALVVSRPRRLSQSAQARVIGGPEHHVSHGVGTSDVIGPFGVRGNPFTESPESRAISRSPECISAVKPQTRVGVGIELKNAPERLLGRPPKIVRDAELRTEFQEPRFIRVRLHQVRDGGTECRSRGHAELESKGREYSRRDGVGTGRR